MKKILVNVVGVYIYTHGIYNTLIIDNKSVEKTDYVDVQGIGI